MGLCQGRLAHSLRNAAWLPLLLSRLYTHGRSLPTVKKLPRRPCVTAACLGALPCGHCLLRSLFFGARTAGRQAEDQQQSRPHLSGAGAQKWQIRGTVRVEVAVLANGKLPWPNNRRQSCVGEGGGGSHSTVEMGTHAAGEQKNSEVPQFLFPVSFAVTQCISAEPAEFSSRHRYAASPLQQTLFMSFCVASEACHDRILRRSSHRFSTTRNHLAWRKLSSPQTEQGARFVIA